MIAWLKRLIAKLKGPVKAPNKPIETPKPVGPPKVEAPVKIESDGVPWSEWCRLAMIQSGSFEGHGEDWGNPVGNFDGAYLTCGLLGFTWKWNNQPPMILKFIERYGVSELLKLMPQTGSEYIRAANLGESGGKSIVSGWSNSSKVREPYFSELKVFWSSLPMRKIQIETSEKMFGEFAKKKTLEGASFFKIEPKLSHYKYWFDQAVLNGTGKTVPFAENGSVTNFEVLNWCKTASGYTTQDLRKNAALWNEMLDDSPADLVALWRMAYIRAQSSRQEFKPVTMNRRGTLALGEGWVNGEKRKT